MGSMPNLIIIGASARAAAASAIRAGFTPWTADLFADRDLREMVPDAIRCPAEQYPQGFVDILKQAPDATWMYTGALENSPNLIRKLIKIRPLWGNGTDALLASRSPFFIARLLERNGLPALEVRLSDGERSPVHRWLQKPLRGAAGNGIRFSVERNPSGYFQQYIEGTSMSANFVRARGRVKLLGITEQLIGIDWLNAPPFRYAGNIGPAEVSEPCRAELTRIGEVIGNGCGLLGLFGVDFILAENRPWVVEVNPRYTASVEVLERAMDFSLLSEHRTAFADEFVPPRMLPGHSKICGKAILYAEREFVFSSTDWPGREDLENFADIPHQGDLIQAGWPILTILATGNSTEECRTELKSRANILNTHLHLSSLIHAENMGNMAY